MKEKSNKQFMILSAITIIMVVDAHSWPILKLGSSIYPYNSFFMAAFFFVSGYFLDLGGSGFGGVIKKKVKKLLIPYLLWTLAYALLINLLRAYTNINIGVPFEWKEYVLGILFNGEILDINAPGYFVLILFYTEMGYLLFRRLFGKVWNEWIAMAIFSAMGYGVVFRSIEIGSQYNLSSPGTMLMKVAFCLQFLQLGSLYKNKIEGWMNKYSPLRCCCFSSVLMWLITWVVGDTGWNLNWLIFNSKLLNMNNIFCLTPLATSVLGICFWLSLSKILVPSFGGSRLVNYISNHTFVIMMNHIFFMANVNWVLVLVNRYFAMPGFDINSALTTSWYRYSGIDSGMYFVYFATGFTGSLFLCHLLDKVRCFKEKGMYFLK
nr:acyltransferase family protein [uncultured Acetatifactor sp.]